MASEMNVSSGGIGTVVPEHNGKYKTIVYVICTIAALGGLLFGLDQGFIANALNTIGHITLLTLQVQKAIPQYSLQVALLEHCFREYLPDILAVKKV
jgi:hypothetical protein